MKRLLKYALWVALAFAGVACDGEATGDTDRKTDEVLVVQGVVYDPATRQMVRNIEIVLSTYASSDKKQQNPLDTQSQITQREGYQFRLEHIREGQTYSIYAKDPSGTLTDSETLRILDINHEGNSYNPETGSYLRTVDFEVAGGALILSVPR